MTRRVVVLPEAEEEFAEAADWYEERRPGLGVEFVAELDEAFAAISERPEAAPVWRSDRSYRKRLLRRFPYVVFYTIVGSDAVEVTAVAHAKRRPGYWLAR